MKKLYYLLLTIVFVGFISSCDKEEEVTDEPKPEETIVTPEESKANLEQDGLDLLSELQAIEQSQSVQTGTAMVNFMDLADPFAGNTGAAKILKMAEPVFDFVNIERGGIKPIYKAMKNPTEDPESFQEAFNMASGIYEWNASTSSWDYTDSGNSVLFKFPSTETGTTNNAYLEIKDYVGYTGSVPYIDPADYSGDLPQAVKVEMGVDGAAVLLYTLAVDYSSEGIPESVSTSLSFDGYTMAFAVNNNAANTEAGFEHSFTHGDKTLMAAGAGVKGNWTESNVDANIRTETHTEYEWDFDPETGEWYQTDVVLYTEEYQVIDAHNIFREANATFQIMNTKVEGIVDIQSLANGIEDVYANDHTENFDWDAATVKEAALINEHALLKVKYADSDAVIAVMEAYTYEDTYTDMEWNDSTGDYEEVEFTETVIGVRMKFTDGSLVDADTYFESGFDDMIAQYENWIDDLENTYGK